ncbi:DolP-mannose mannosyltransferase [Salinirarus marinus]|uniref:DolP-mannose mannosyltransferase n=1 Tax=Salinirarus marinus TaxID=3068310 RepID=UPI003C6CAAF0
MAPSRRLRLRRTVSRSRLVRAWQDCYWLVVGVLVAFGVVSMGRPFLGRHGYGPPLPHNDSVILEYVGWFLAQGNTLYTDIWEIKPPLAFAPTYAFAHLTGSNMYLHHLLGIATTTAALAATAAFTARIVGTVTESPEAGAAAGIAFFALPDLFYLPWLGYKAKIMVFAFGLAALDRAVRGDHFESGVLAGLSVGFWQLALVFPAVTTLYAARTKSWANVRRHVLGGALALAAILATLVLYADAGGFLAEVVLGPVVLETEQAPFDPKAYLAFFPGSTGGWLTLAGLSGLAVAFLDSEEPTARPLAVGGLLVLGVLFVDFDGLWDTVYPLVFTAVGVGVLVSHLSRRAQVAAVVVLVLLVTPAFAPSEFIRQDPVDTKPSDGLPPAIDAERESVYWNHRPIESCRFFGAGTQRSLLQYYPNADVLAEAPCGELDLYWAVTRQRLFGSDAPPPR